MRLNSKAVAVLIFVILFGGIFAAKATGLWQKEAGSMHGKIQNTDHIDEAIEEHEEHERGGPLTTIAGRTTVKEIVDAGIELERIEELLGTKVKNVNLRLRDICEDNGLPFADIKNTITGWLRL
jgi:predicted transposase YdaD